MNKKYGRLYIFPEPVVEEKSAEENKPQKVALACDSCKHVFLLVEAETQYKIEFGVTVKFFKCPACGRKYITSVEDQLINRTKNELKKYRRELRNTITRMKDHTTQLRIMHGKTNEEILNSSEYENIWVEFEKQCEYLNKKISECENSIKIYSNDLKANMSL